MYVDLRFEEENFAEDLAGDDDDRREYAERLQAKYKATRGMDAFTRMVMSLEDEATATLLKKLKISPSGHGRESYNDDGTLSVRISVDTVADVIRVRDIFDRDGRWYGPADYVTAEGLTLLPQGVNGPIYKTEGSSFMRGDDLDDWIEEHAPKKRAARKTRR